MRVTRPRAIMLAASVLLAACTSVPGTVSKAARPSGIANGAPSPTASVAATLPTSTPRPLHPLSIEGMRQQEYPGSDVVIEQTLAPGSNYQRYIASYRSEGLRIFALLTVPNGGKPAPGWPAIIFNHGFIPPAEYRTTERYVAYVDGFARSGYIVFRPDYRGHGSSEGQPSGAYGSPAYTIDVLNALASVKKFRDADPARIGMWGHSMGGHLTLRSMVTVKDIKAAVIWAGVVAPYPDLITNWGRGRPAGVSSAATSWRQNFIEQYGGPDQNPLFWNSISPNTYLDDVSGPVQLHHGTADASVPIAFSEGLNRQLREASKTVEYFVYPGDDHNLSHSFGLAMERSIAFFDQYVKGR